MDSAETLKRAEEFERKLSEHEAAQEQVARRYDPREACRRSSEIRTVQDETLGEVRFGVLSISEFTDLRLSEIKDENARIRKVVHAMLRKADPELTLAEVEAIPFDEFTILNGILGEALPGFLRLAQQALKTGSQLTRTRKPSA